MNFSYIKYVGCDLDQTLYPKSPEIDTAIQANIYTTLGHIKHITQEEAKNLFYKYYPGISGRKTLIALGLGPDDAEKVVQDALENADLTPFLKPDPKVLSILTMLGIKYPLTLITGSNQKLAYEKLKSLQIPAQLFKHIITGEISKSDGTAFKEWMNYYPGSTPEQFLYIGDRKSTDVDLPLTLGMKAILVNVAEQDANLQVLQLKSFKEIMNKM